MAAIYSDHNLQSWKTTAGKVVHRMPFDAEALRVGVSPDGKYLVILFPNEAIIYLV